ncbi:uncharacterized protein [Antedon mediterranea]|uniref:uncharacterized protein isoform X2 n=1 Tax=Antedon mediterranea TaxID=105859 RepID=UPI003AF61300
MPREWENRFSDIVRETEANLSKVRNRLDSSSHHGVYNSFKESRRSKPQHSSGSYRGRRDPYSPSSPSNYIDAHLNSSLTSYRPTDGLNLTDNTPGLVALLSEKIENQNKMIQTLALQVKSLENDRERSNNQVKQLQSDLSMVNRRLAEKGVDLETEMKLQNLQREMKFELGDLQTQVKMQSKDTVAVNDDIAMNLMRDVTDCKRYQQEDSNTIRRDIESLRTRLIKIEIDLSGQAGDNKEVMRRIDRVERGVSEISASGQRHIRELGQTTREKQQAKQEINQIRSEMERLQDSISKLESGSHSFTSSLKNTKRNKKTHRKTKQHGTRQREKDLFSGSSIEDSDNDTSIDMDKSPVLMSNAINVHRAIKTVSEVANPFQADVIVKITNGKN